MNIFCLFLLQLNLIVSGTSEKLTVMLEGEANNLDKQLFLEGIRCGLESCAQIARQIKQGMQIINNFEKFVLQYQTFPAALSLIKLT